jgi:DNA-binding transcriptional ArsR family regulator
MPQRRNDVATPSVSEGPDLASQFKALGHPVRLEMVRQLAARDQCCCSDFCNCLPLAQSTISQHLDQLRQAGLIEFQSDGNRSRYSLKPDAFDALGMAIGALTLTAGRK